MTAVEFLVQWVSTGHLLGFGTGCPLTEIDELLPLDFTQESAGRNWLRRDYGLLALDCFGGPAWTLGGASLELHRIPAQPGIVVEWCRVTGVSFPRFMPWRDLADAVARRPDVPVRTRSEQGDFTEYRFAAGPVKVVVVAAEDERGDWPGQGDIWSVHLG
ncbi:hypothetical protein [Streptomyces sp. NBC_01497]|uniref:hypothetical protein n=1 Tax=Streptomyces sp. NBC_01497 TaxID=2903885 RepID=UPI002E30C4E2|nr:hypothetical protein [Streptomyces sp. NBC_01497]